MEFLRKIININRHSSLWQQSIPRKRFFFQRNGTPRLGSNIVKTGSG